MRWAIIGIPEDEPETIVALLRHTALETTSARLLPGSHLPGGVILYASPGDAIKVVCSLQRHDKRLFPSFNPLLVEVSEPIIRGFHQVRRAVVPFDAVDQAKDELGDVLRRHGIPLAGMDII